MSLFEKMQNDKIRAAMAKDIVEKKTKGLQEEIIRCRELLKLYEKIPAGAFGAAMIRGELLVAEEALKNGNAIGITRSYRKLKECE